jgi:hypothetical protein
MGQIDEILTKIYLFFVQNGFFTANIDYRVVRISKNSHKKYATQITVEIYKTLQFPQFWNPEISPNHFKNGITFFCKLKKLFCKLNFLWLKNEFPFPKKAQKKLSCKNVFITCK